MPMSPVWKYIDLKEVLPPLVELARNAEGDRDVLDAVLRLAFAFGVATAPTEEEGRRKLVVEKLTATFDTSRVGVRARFSEDLTK